MKQPDYVTIRAPCGNIVKVHPGRAEALKAELTKSHEETDGCPYCQPSSTPQPPKDFGSSLLDYAKPDKNE